MIRGIGVDIVEIPRIEECIARYGDRFLNKVFTAPEIGYCTGKNRSSVHFAGRWAAKEAFFKSLPPECQVIASWKSVQILQSDNGRPVIEICSEDLYGRSRKAGIERFYLSLTHERSLCVALVVAE
jgi:holo-[acyl-carrier protein] synthase